MPTAADNTPIAAPIEKSYTSTPAGGGGIVDPTGSLTEVLGKFGADAKDVDFSFGDSDMTVTADEAASAGVEVPEGAAAPAAPAVAAPPPAAAPAAAPPPPADPAALPTAEERKAYIAATSKAAKAEREAAQKLARAQASERNAQALAKQAQDFAAATADWQKDPTAIIRAAGLSEADYFQRLAEHALQTADQPPPDPVAVEVERRMAPYVRAQQEAAALAQQHQQALAETSAIVQKVLPVISTGGDKYETLVALHGGDASKAAVYVYQKMKERFIEDGTLIPADEAAAELEEYHYNQQLEGLRAAKALKKLQAEFGVQAPPVAAAAPPHAPTKPPPSPTLTAAAGPKVTPMAPVRSGNKIVTQRNTVRTGDKDLDEVMNMFRIT